MTTSFISSLIPADSESSVPAAPLGEITNFITPPRRKLWSQGIEESLKTLPKGCSIAVGDTQEQAAQIHNESMALRRFRLGVLQRETLTEFYRFLGSRHTAFNADDVATSSRGKFFASFLLPKKADMIAFLSRTTLQVPSPSDGNIDEIFEFINPGKTIKELNSVIHDITLDDLYTLIQDVSILQPSKLSVWQDVCTRITGEVDVEGWQSDKSLLARALAVRLSMMDDPFIIAAVNFEEQQQQNANAKFAATLTRKGLLPSTIDVKNLREYVEDFKKSTDSEIKKGKIAIIAMTTVVTLLLAIIITRFRGI